MAKCEAQTHISFCTYVESAPWMHESEQLTGKGTAEFEVSQIFARHE